MIRRFRPTPDGNSQVSPKFFRSATSLWPSGMVVNFAPFSGGTIQGVIEYKIASGSVTVNASNVVVSLGRSFSGGDASFKSGRRAISQYRSLTRARSRECCLVHDQPTAAHAFRMYGTLFELFVDGSTIGVFTTLDEAPSSGLRPDPCRSLKVVF